MLHRCIAIKPVIPVHSLNELFLFFFFICQQGKPAASRADSFSIFMYLYFLMISIIQKNKCHKESFFSLFPDVMILFSSIRSVSANNWVTLMGHDMYKAWHVGMLRYWCCSKRKASSSCCFVSHSFIYLFPNTCRLLYKPSPSCFVPAVYHPASLHQHSLWWGSFFLPSPPLFGVLQKVIKRVHFHTYFSQPGWQQALILLFTVLERSLWQPCLQLYVLICGK